MSILLVRLPAELAEVLSARLISQGDEVRVLTTPGEDIGDLAGVHVASGTYLDDPDLTYRAGQSVRTLVLGAEVSDAPSVAAIVEGARDAGVSRIVYCASEPDEATVVKLRDAGIEYVVLATGSVGLLRRSPAVALEDIAEAVDAADDLQGPLHLELDLTDPVAWAALKLDPPQAGAPR